MKTFIDGLPKAELHIHIEGSLEPELMFMIAQRNGIQLPYSDIAALKQAYRFANLQEFLDLYYAGMAVLRTAQDFYDLAFAYFKRAHQQNIIHAEIFFDPQAHTARGVAFDDVIQGLTRAAREAQERFDLSTRIILCFLRDHSVASAEQTLDTALRYRKEIHGVGLDSAEIGNPPSKFKTVFSRAKAEGFALVAHAGEEGPSDYIWQALKELQVQRIDHGIRCLEDPELVATLAERQIPLTLCPLSNLQLKVFTQLTDYPLMELLKSKLVITINSDDPAYFGGYLNENYLVLAEQFKLSKDIICQLAGSSFTASFISDEKKAYFKNKLKEYCERA